MKKVIKNQGVTIYQENKDCVVINGVFSGCVFTMPQPKGKKNKEVITIRTGRQPISGARL